MGGVEPDDQPARGGMVTMQLGDQAPNFAAERFPDHVKVKPYLRTTRQPQ
jgi:hypothetical protein